MYSLSLTVKRKKMIPAGFFEIPMFRRSMCNVKEKGLFFKKTLPHTIWLTSSRLLMESEAVCAGERLQLLAHIFVAEDQPGPARSGHHEVLD